MIQSEGTPALKFEVFDGLDNNHIEAILEIERLQALERPRMLPLNLTTVREHHLGLIAFQAADYAVAGYNGILTEYPNRVLEIGGLYVPEHLRGRGIAKAIKAEMFKRICDTCPAHSLITFCNEASQHLNEEFGFRRANTSEIPEEAFIFCRTECPTGKKGMELLHAAGKLCCDNILVHDPLGIAVPAGAAVEAR